MWASQPTPVFLGTLPAASSFVGWTLLLLAVAWSLRTPPDKNPGPGRWGWWALLGAVLVFFRWPLITLPHELYPDESQLLAGAITLRHDPVFWRSVDCGTAGPLDCYALLPAAFFPGTTAYAAARLTAVLLLWGLLVAAGETLALVANHKVARLAVLPALAFEALTTSPEFIHYSTELVPGVLLAFAVLAGVRQSIRPSVRNLWAAALLLGAIPFAKLQAAPVAAALGLALVIQEIVGGRSKNAGLLVGVALLPALLVIALVTVTGQAEHMVIPYFLQNLQYAQIGRLSVGRNILQLAEQSVTNGYHALWLGGSAVFCTGVALVVRPAPGRLRRYGLGAAALLAVSLCCILTPGRPYHHYLNLLTLPVTLLSGIGLALALASPTCRGPALPVGLLLLCGLLPQLGLRASPRADPFAYYNSTLSARGPAHGELVAAIKTLSSPGETLGLWGWRSSLYVEAGLPQATRQANTIFQFLTGPWQKYYLSSYYDSLVTAAPPVFVDTAGPDGFWFNRRSMGHEVYPLLREWVASHYRYIGEWDGVRVYVRLDRPIEPPG